MVFLGAGGFKTGLHHEKNFFRISEFHNSVHTHVYILHTYILHTHTYYIHITTHTHI